MIILGKKRYFFSAENLNNQKRDIFPKKKRGSAAILCFIFLEFLIPDFCETVFFAKIVFEGVQKRFRERHGVFRETNFESNGRCS